MRLGKEHLPRVTAWLSVGLQLVIEMVVRILLLHGRLPRDEFANGHRSIRVATHDWKEHDWRIRLRSRQGFSGRIALLRSVPHRFVFSRREFSCCARGRPKFAETTWLATWLIMRQALPDTGNVCYRFAMILTGFSSIAAFMIVVLFA